MTFVAPGPCINVTGNTVLASVVNLLRAALNLDESQCFEVTNADDVPEIPLAGDLWVTVAQGDGQFEPGNQDVSQLTEETEVILTAYTRIVTDRTDHAHDLITDPQRGLLEAKRLLLKTMLTGNILTDENGNTFLREYAWITRSSPPQVGRTEEDAPLIGRIQVVCRLSFDWDLT